MGSAIRHKFDIYIYIYIYVYIYIYIHIHIYFIFIYTSMQLYADVLAFHTRVDLSLHYLLHTVQMCGRCILGRCVGVAYLDASQPSLSVACFAIVSGCELVCSLASR